jgi:integrase
LSTATLDPLFQPYLDELEFMRRRDHKTVSRNRYALARLTLHLNEHGLTAAEVDNGFLGRYFVGLLDTMAESTVAVEVSSVKAAYRFAVEEGRIEKAPVIRFEQQNGDAEPHTFTNEQLRRIREQCGEDLDWLIFHLLAYTGCRRFEIVGLTWEDVDFENRELRVVGKRKKLRKVPIHPVLYRVLREQHQKRPDSETVLGPGGSLRNVNHRLTALLQRAGVDGGNRPLHAFRKTVASVLIEEGARQNDVDKIMGWSAQDVKGRYYVRTNPNLQETMKLLYKSDPIERRAESLQAVA